MLRALLTPVSWLYLWGLKRKLARAVTPASFAAAHVDDATDVAEPSMAARTDCGQERLHLLGLFSALSPRAAARALAIGSTALATECIRCSGDHVAQLTKIRWHGSNA